MPPPKAPPPPKSDATKAADEAKSKELEAHEFAVIGIMLQEPSMIDRIASTLDAEMFQHADTRKMFSAILTMHAAGVKLSDSDAVGTSLHAQGVSEDRCTIKALRRIRTEGIPHNLDWNAAEIRKVWKHRTLQALCIETHQRLQNSRDADVEFGWLESRMSSLVTGVKTLETRRADAIADEVLAELRESATTKPGVMSGIYTLDEYIGPMMPGELCIVAARPGCGKTSLAMQIAQHVATRGQTVFVSLEMKDRELIRRTLSAIGGVDSRKLRESNVTQTDFDSLLGARNELTGLPLEICSPPRATVQQICGVAKYRAAIGGKVRMLLVDYIGLVQVAGEDRRLDRHLQVGLITGALKSLAKELECPVVALAQLNRDAQEREPTLANLRESGSIEQDADIVLLIHHPPGEQMANIVIAKHRHGRTGKLRIRWNPTTTSFGEKPTAVGYGGGEWTG